MTPLELLRELEWEGSNERRAHVEPSPGAPGNLKDVVERVLMCPRCKRHKHQGHAPGCELAEMLAHSFTV